MTGNLYIDGQDAYSLYRVFVTKDGYKDLVVFPALKTVESNDWAEEDGKEFDLSSPVLDSHELSINFSFHGDDSRFGGFIERLSDMSYHDFNFNEIGKTYRLRLVSQPGMTQISTLGTFSLRFADDFPLYEYSYTAPQSGIVQYQGYELDGRDFSEYGIYILQGSEVEILKSPASKKNLLRNINSKSGAIYDGKYVTFQTKEVKLNCLMRAISLSEFWRNYHAFFYDFTRPYERILYVDSTGYNYPCYYKNCTVSNFSPNGKIWFQFSLVLVFTSFRVEDDEYILASEAGEWIITEDEEYAIDLSVYGN
jgi:hypothetical protein